MSDEKVNLGKGRPTPKRREAQGRRGGPVAPPPQTRREAARRMREQQAQARRDVREGTRSGDPARMLPRDAGPARALVRDLVDGRRNFGVLLLPVALLLVVAQVSQSLLLLDIAIRAWTVVLVVVVVDLVALSLQVRRQVRTALPEETRTRGHVTYALLRATVFRRFRMPPPRVAPGALFRR